MSERLESVSRINRPKMLFHYIHHTYDMLSIQCEIDLKTLFLPLRHATVAFNLGTHMRTSAIGGWEITYGDYRLWRYEVLADFGNEYGSVPGPNFNDGAVPTLPDPEHISEEEAIALAVQYLPLYNGKLQTEQLLQCQISSRFSKDKSAYSYISQDGTWIIGFGENNGPEPELLCYIYISGLNGDGQFAYFPDDAAYVGPPENAERIVG